MRKQMFFMAALMPLALGCGQDGPLSQEQVGMLRGLNQMQATSNEAFDRAGAFFPSGSARAGSKGDKLVPRLANCDVAGRRPHLRFDRNNNGEFVVDGGGCPVAYRQKQWYRVDAKEWFVYEDLKVRDEDYRRLNGMGGRTLRGTIRRSSDGMNAYEVSGNLALYGFETLSYGRVSAELATRQRHYDGNTLGEVRMVIRSSDGWQHEARLSWEGLGSTRFFVDGNELERAPFLDLFSSYGLIEIMANGERMR